jgi:hypothetical protein
LTTLLAMSGPIAHAIRLCPFHHGRNFIA